MTNLRKEFVTHYLNVDNWVNHIEILERGIPDKEISKLHVDLFNYCLNRPDPWTEFMSEQAVTWLKLKFNEWKLRYLISEEFKNRTLH